MADWSITNDMYVTKRDNTTEVVSFDKILNRIKAVGKEADIQINYTTLVIKVIDQIYDKIPTAKIDELLAEQCASMSSIHPDYNTLAGRIVVSNHHKNTSDSFSSVVRALYSYTDKHDNPSPLVNQEYYNTVCENAEEFDAMCDYKNDYLIEYFGFKTLEKSYLIRINGRVVERPQHMWLRVAVCLHGSDIEKVRESYYYMSNKYFTHATPTLFNAGTPHQQLASCFLEAMEDDSIDGIFNTVKDCASISKWAGGIGLHIHNVRATGSQIRGTNGTSNGIVPMLRVFNHTAKYVDQCLDPETVVYTKRGPIPIKNIVVGDKIIADDGNLYEIGKILDNQYYGDMYLLEIKHTLSPLKLTDMHPLWTIKNNTYIQRNFDNIINMLDRNLIIPEFIEAKNIDKNDFIGFPIPQYEKDIINYTEEDCRFYGILLGDGNISTTNNLAYVALNKDTKSETIKFVENYLSKLNIHITYTENGDKYLRLTWTRTSMFKFTYEMCYDNNKEKYIMPNMLHLPKPKILQLIKGILETDGKVKDYQIVLEITSQNIVEGIRYMLLRLGILSSGSIRDRIGENHVTKSGSYIECKKKSYILIVPKKKIICDLFPEKKLSVSASFTFFEHDNYLFSIVNNNTVIKDYSGRVIDIEVDNEDHHNFLTHNGLVKNGGGKRNGSIAVYLEPWHADIEIFLQMRKNHGDEELKARDLFYALWIPDLFMRRVKHNEKWTLMCPDECPGLSDVYGEEFDALYTKYEQEGRGRISIDARNLWYQILDAQMETGTPYLLYKDAVNKKSNQKNLGTIKSSNLCVAPETLILTDKGHVEIQKLEGQKTNVWNGEEFSEVTVFKTGENQELIEVYTNDGSRLTCTKYHKFFIQTPEGVVIKPAMDLSVDDVIAPCNFPIVNGHDGTFGRVFSKLVDENLKKREPTISNEFCYANTPEDNFLCLYSSNFEFVMSIKLMLQTCGINPRFFETQPQNEVFDDIVDRIYTLRICPFQLQELMKLDGFSSELLVWKEMDDNHPHMKRNDARTCIKISKIEDLGRRDDTFCFTEPKKNAGIFNGILTSQCTEIMQYSDNTETAVCNIASIALPAFLNYDTTPPTFDFEKLGYIAKIVTENLNRVIDISYYPIEKARRSNMRHRPIGIGVQGLADVYILMNLTFSSDEARELNHNIFETIYYSALERSMELAYRDGPYETFEGSPASQGILQFDMWDYDPTNKRHDWTNLKKQIKQYGLRNSLLLAPMPTASTSQILGYNECIEPITSNIYSRRTIAGEFMVTNKYLMLDLIGIGLWNEKIKNNIIANNGSIQQIDIIPDNIKEKYKTCWEISMAELINQSASRGNFVCQSQSLNLWVEEPNYNNLTSMHFYAWSKGLKTGIYYLRRRARAAAQQFTIEPEKREGGNHEDENPENYENHCEMCSA